MMGSVRKRGSLVILITLLLSASPHISSQAAETSEPPARVLPVIPNQNLQQIAVAGDHNGLEIVAVDSPATNLIEPDVNSNDDVYLFNTGTVPVGNFQPGAVRRVTQTPSGNPLYSNSNLVPGDGWGLKIDPSGRYLAFVSRTSPLTGNPAGLVLALHDIANSSTVEIGSAASVALSRNADVVAYTNDGIKLWHRASGTTYALLPGVPVTGFQISADADTLVFTSGADDLRLPHPWKSAISARPLPEALYAVSLDPTTGRPLDPDSPQISAIDAWTPSNQLDMAVSDDGLVRYRTRDWLGCECNRAGVMRWNSQRAPFNPSSPVIGQVSTLNSPYAVAAQADGTALQNIGAEDGWVVQTADISSGSESLTTLDLSPLSHNSLRPVGVSEGSRATGYVQGFDAASTTYELWSVPLGIEPPEPPLPDPAVTPTEGPEGTSFTFTYSCPIGSSATLTIQNLDGSPAPGVSYGIQLSGNNRDYSQSAIVRTEGTFYGVASCDGLNSGSVRFEVKAPPVDCGDATVIGVRGSGEKEGDADALDYAGRHATAIGAVLKEKYGINLVDPLDVEGDGIHGLAYPAVSVGQAAGGYLVSHNSGVDSLEKTISSIQGLCGGDQPLLLVGFSQGAHVVQSLLDKVQSDDVAEDIAGVALLASPRFSPADPSARGTFLRGFPKEGFANGSVVPSLFQGLTRTYCLDNDPVCAASPKSIGGSFIRVNKTHSLGYDARISGNPIIADAAGLLASSILEGGPNEVAAKPNGAVTAYRLKDLGLGMAVTATELFSDGSPSTYFAWDFDGDGITDEAGTSPWLPYPYRTTRGRVAATVTVSFGDGTSADFTVCISKQAVTCRN